MKKLLIILLSFITIASFAQRQPNVLGDPLLNKIAGIKTNFLGIPLYDNLAIPTALSTRFPDSIFVGGVVRLKSDKKLYLYDGGGMWEETGGGTTIITGTSGGFVLDTTINWLGQSTTIPIFTHGAVISSVGIKDSTQNGSGYLSFKTVDDTTYIFYSSSPYGNVHFILSGRSIPIEPTSLNVTDIDEYSVLLTWDSAEHAQSVQIDRSDDSLNYTNIAFLAPRCYKLHRYRVSSGNYLLVSKTVFI